MGLMAAENAARVLRGEAPVHIINPEVLLPSTADGK
jgi:hypothetical protein